MLKKIILVIPALWMVGCSNVQTEYEKQKKVLQNQKIIIQELSDTNAHLKKRNLQLTSDVQQVKASSEHQARVNQLDQDYEKKLEQMIDELSQQLNSGASDSGVSVVRTSLGAVIRLEEKIVFKPGSYRLSRSGESVLSNIIEILKGYPDKIIRIDGHTDSDPIRKSKHSSNWDLSAKRATKVIEFLSKTSEINPEKLYLAAFSQYRPLDPNNKSANRRVEIAILDQ